MTTPKKQKNMYSECAYIYQLQGPRQSSFSQLIPDIDLGDRTNYRVMDEELEAEMEVAVDVEEEEGEDPHL